MRSSERGDIDAQSSAWASWKFRRYDQIKAGKLIPLVQVGLKREPDWPKIPLMQELTEDPDTKTILEFLSVGGAIGRSISVPPGMPAERVTALRKAFAATVKDPEFLADAKKQRLNIDSISGEKLDQITAKALKTRKSLVARAVAAMQGDVEKCTVNCVKKKK